MQLNGLGALVTGGASGLGAATAERLAGAGARVTIADLNEAAGMELAERIGGQFVRTDVTDPAQCAAAVAAATNAGSLGVLVCCAGIVLAERMLGRDGVHDPARFKRVIEVNLIGTFQMMLYAAQAMSQNQPNEEGERGVIVNTASIAAFDGQIGQVAYAASKAGVVGMGLPAARELARFGIRVMTIAPGIFDTAMMASLPAAARESLGAQVPFPSRLGRPAEYAALVQHIIENPMLNGEVIRLDGAIRMAPK
ncbi:SDR family NAD(P)-dependent oxidoreductase [Chloroflexus aggregans]|uniref:Short-chain dehydrogenase/reductase SDR n=1 Tax=Chloroflexus aggregans (strain MD-66 / DSM 9485) TaxID=326427 RepID=B8G4G8_CHLAD|nr:SDR family NAD(P)-dependent oxidoreductase [Chloroflexus aggregans]ACL23574.1 short-chain dehydrogenase/reductase SDR [Chloroflexus aggregans DSM 9485]